MILDVARTSGATVHSASLMDICHLKNAELDAKHQKYKGRVVLRGDIVKDNSGSCAVFTEQRSAASQMTAAKIMDIISRLPGCDGQAADAVSGYTQVKMKDAHKSLKVPKSECPDIWICLPKHQWPNSWSSMEDPVVLLERNLYVHPVAGLLWERQFEKVLFEHCWEKFRIGNACSLTEFKALFLSVCVDDIKLAGKKQNINPTWTILMKDVDFGRTNIFPGSCILGMHSMRIQFSMAIMDNYKSMFSSRISAWATEKLPETKATVKLDAETISSWSCDMEGHEKNVWKDIVNLRTKRFNSNTKSQYHAWTTINLKKKKKLIQLENSSVCSQIVVKCLELARIDRPDILWFVNKLARTVTKWTKAFDKRLARLISYIHHTCEYSRYSYVGNTAQQ